MTSLAEHIELEIEYAPQEEASGNKNGAFARLERAHILGQARTVSHVRVHLLMLYWAFRHHDSREIFGQLIRIIGAATKTAFGWIPQGNSGGANVSAFKSMPIPADLEAILQSDR